MRASLCWFTLMLLFLPGCGGTATPKTDLGSGLQTTSSSRGLIGVSLLTLENPFFKVIGDNITAEAAKHGYTTLFRSC